MPLYRIQGPDGKTYSIEGPEGATREEVIDAIQYRMAQPSEASKDVRPEDVGILTGAGAALKRGFESFGDIASGFGLAGAKLFGTDEEARQKMEEIKKEQAVAPETPMMTVADFERIASEKGVLEAAKEAPKYILEQLGLSAPQMAVPIAVGAGATALAAPTGPLAPVIGAAAGIGAYGLQQFGNFLVTQAVEKNDPEELDLAKAAIAAGGTAPLGYFVDRFIVGLGGVGKNAGKEAAKELASRSVALQTGKRVAGGAAVGIIAEAPTEVLEQVAERWQAGKDLTDEDAYREYKEAFFGAAAIGGTIGGASRGIRGYREARQAQLEAQTEAPVEPNIVSRNIYEITDIDGNPSQVTVTQDDIGNILARDDKGEEVDLTNLISRGISVEDAVKNTFSFDEAPEPAPIEPVTPVSSAAPVGPELITPQMPDIPPRQVPTSYLPDREPVEPITPELPKLLGYSPTAGQEPMYVFSDGSVAIGEDAAFARRYEPQKLSPEELSQIAPDLEGVEFQPVKQPKLPLTPEEEAELAAKPQREKEEKQRIKELEKRYAKLTRAPEKGEDLRKVLYRQLDDKSVYEIGTDKQFNYYRAPKKQQGKSLESYIEDSLLDAWLPDDLVINQGIDSPEVILDKEQRGFEYILERLRNEDFVTEAAKNEAASIENELNQIAREIEREAGRENLRDILTEIYEDEIGRGFEPGQPEYEAPVATEPDGTTRIERAAQTVTPQVGDIISRRALPDNMEARVFRTTDGYGASLYDKDSGNVVSGSVTRYKGADAQAKAEARAKKLENETVKPEGKKSFYSDLLPSAGFKRLNIEDPRTYKNKSGEPFLTFERDGVRVAFSSNNILFADERGRVSAYSDEPENTIFRALIVDKDQRKKGKAAQAVSEIVDMADRSGTNLYLEPASLDVEGMTTQQLKNFYKRFGFKPQQATGPVSQTDKVMVRMAGEKAVGKPTKQGPSVEEKAIADRERGLFALQPQVAERVGAPTGDLFGAEGIQQIQPAAPKGRAAPAGQLSLFLDSGDRVENKAGKTDDLSPEKLKEAKRVEKAIEGKTPLFAAKWLAKNASTPDYRLIAGRIADRMQKLMNAGLPFSLKVSHVGDRVPIRLARPGVRGLSVTNVDRETKTITESKIWLNGTDVTGKVGTDEETLLHELTHSVTSGANYLGRFKALQNTEAAKLSNRLADVFNAVVKHYNDRAIAYKNGTLKGELDPLELKVFQGPSKYFLEDTDEILAYGLTNQQVRNYLESIPYKGKTAWSGFVDAIRQFLGLPKSKETALSEILSIADVMFDAPLIEVGQREAAAPTAPISTKEQIQLLRASTAGLSNDQKGKAALDIVNILGRGLEPTKTKTEKLKEAILDDRGNLKITPETAKKEAVKFLDRVETWVFSSDAAFDNAVRRTINQTTKSQQEKIGALLSISSSQAVHADAVASLFMRYGAIRYDPETYKYEAVDKKDNLISLVKDIDALASTYNMSKEQAERVAHTAFEAKRLRSLQDFNDNLDLEIADLRSRIKQAKRDGDLKAARIMTSEVRRKTKDFKFIHMTDQEIEAGLRLIDLMPKEMNKIIDTWNNIRLNAGAELVRSGLWSVAEAEVLLSNMDYVPFYREDQLEQGKGPKEFLRSLQVQAKEKKLKGSKLAVNDVFDNMARWTQYSVKRSVMNRLALAKIDAALEAGIAKKVDESRKTRDSVRVWRNGEAEFYNLDDPMFMEAFAGLEPISIPTWKIAAKFSTFLRQSVVLNPLFSLSQVPQDAIAAIYTSGLQPRYALSIPFRAVKEFVKTLANVSKTHKDLERVAAVGIKDFTAAIARNDAEVAAGLRSKPGVWNKVKGVLEHISMASDNAVRQAVYEASIAQGVSRGEAIEKAFQLINFKNRGSSKALALAGQVVPFFNAYLAAQHVALKVLSGRGISPSERRAALKTLIYTTASVQALSLVYSMMMDDDEDYKNTPSIIRDRLIMIPGVKMSIPIRPDIFSIPKILTEHTYMLLTNQGSEDGRKFRDSMKAAAGNALLGPTPVPQVIKPVAEVIMNYSFFQGRPLIGTYQKGLETERQFNDSTSELAKALGNTGMISPIAADHLIRGMLGSVGGLISVMSNQLIHTDPSVPRPEMTLREALAAIPGTSGFIRREYETGIKNDFYVLRDEVSRAVNTLNDIKARSPHEIEEFLADENNINRIGLQKAVNRITKDLSVIRREISRINQAQGMSAREKQQAIKELREIEQEMLSGVNVQELRRIAKL